MKATKVDQVSPTLGEGGDTDQKSNQCGSSEPHPGPIDPLTGGMGVKFCSNITKNAGSLLNVSKTRGKPLTQIRLHRPRAQKVGRENGGEMNVKP